MSTEDSRIAGKLTDIDPHVDADLMWTDHGKEQWDARGNGVGYLRAWSQSEEVDYPSAYDGTRGRYHEASDCVLIVVRERQRHDSVGWRIVDIVRTVIELSDRENIAVQKKGVDCDEATYVRQQVRGGEPC
jgi:hypothetical protein